MPGLVKVRTPDNVEIDYELAGIASRAAAMLIDSALQGLLMGAIVLGFLTVLLALRVSVLGWVTGAAIVAAFLAYWGYYIYFEASRNGQTPGKRAMRLRTIRDGGLPVDLGSAALRNLIRPIDITIIGLVSMLVTARCQRLGDLAAGTLVVRERAEWAGDLESAAEAAGADPAPGGVVRNLELVTPEEFEAARRFVAREAELRADVREQVASRIAGPIMARLGMEDGPGVSYSAVLAEIYRRCVSERGMR